MPRSFWLVLAALSGCCNPPSPDLSGKYRAERAAVEAAVRARGAEVELADPVYEYPAPSGVCPDDALGCCTSGWCAGLFVPDAPTYLAGGAILLPADVALHEYTHRALLDLGWQPPGEEHPESFWEIWQTARRLRDAGRNHQ